MTSVLQEFISRWEILHIIDWLIDFLLPGLQLPGIRLCLLNKINNPK